MRHPHLINRLAREFVADLWPWPADDHLSLNDILNDEGDQSVATQAFAESLEREIKRRRGVVDVAVRPFLTTPNKGITIDFEYGSSKIVPREYRVLLTGVGTRAGLLNFIPAGAGPRWGPKDFRLGDLTPKQVVDVIFDQLAKFAMEPD